MIHSIVLRSLALVGLIGIGIAILALDASDLVFAIGFMTIAVAAVLLTALFFYEVGLSEDRDRASRSSGRSPKSRRG